MWNPSWYINMNPISPSFMVHNIYIYMYIHIYIYIELVDREYINPIMTVEGATL